MIRGYNILIRQSASPGSYKFWAGCWVSAEATAWGSRAARTVHEAGPRGGRRGARPTSAPARAAGRRDPLPAPARPTQPSEPILLPKLRIRLADFPLPTSSRSSHESRRSSPSPIRESLKKKSKKTRVSVSWNKHKVFGLTSSSMKWSLMTSQSYFF